MKIQPLKIATLFAAGALLFTPAVFAQAGTSGTTSPTPAPKTAGGATAKPHSTATTHAAAAPLALTTDKDKLSYALGMNVGKGLAQKMKTDSLDINNAIFLRAMRDALTGAKPVLTEDEEKAQLQKLDAELRSKQEAQTAMVGDVNKAKGDAFLAANKAKDGVVTLPSGLQYKIVTPGTGPKPGLTDSVVCNYRGTLIDGTEFDASAKHGGPATFPVNQVIPGWTEALQLMPVGSKWQLYIPSDLAYGSRGAGGAIGPNSTLIFDIELVSIQGK
ncbi:MAG TPA: FKBP-type peptidyl-prolyl cis-trans isomerase [Candidatus Acidoferrales bacterium]